MNAKLLTASFTLVFSYLTDAQRRHRLKPPPLAYMGAWKIYMGSKNMRKKKSPLDLPSH